MALTASATPQGACVDIPETSHSDISDITEEEAVAFTIFFRKGDSLLHKV